MAELTTTQTFSGGINAVFAALSQFDKYPDYLPGVTSIQVLPARKPGSTCQVRYELKLIKSFYYTLDMYETAPTRMWWTLAESNIMKQSSGSWTLTAAGPESTTAVYGLDVSFSGLVPQRVVDQISKANLPLMMKGFQRLIDDSRHKA